ncbi:6-phosphofructo-2-kinase-domain-containing protein [Pelagophyceae sp. CCMP2097]|nr:6-phosphofructo-2-kinase-domain-containing protein [Pelagophyceae sp. CCMP2097]
MVGLPARGKSYLVKMLLRYLSWLGFPTKIFNVGDMRRRLGMGGVSSDFFRNDDAARRSREDLAMACQEEMYAWLDAQKSSCLAIFDATNTTKARRLALLQRPSNVGGCGVTLIFVESICDDEEILAQNYRMKLGNADYTGQDPESALADFLKRVEEYEARYEAVGDDENGGDISYVKIINVGEKVITRRCSGYLSSQISFYLGNIHIQPRRIWLSLHAESVDNIKNVLGASSGELTIKGAHYANALSAFIQREHSAFVADHAKDLHEDGLDVLILSGNAPVHHSTVAPLLGALRPKHLHTSLLNELCGGDFDGLSVAELERKYPGVWKARNADKLRFRYPGAGGESYLDVIARLRPILIELERERQSVLLVAHMAVLRCLYAYFVGTPVDQIPYLRIPSGAVVELTPTPHGTTVRTFNLIPAVAIPPTDRARYDDVTP